MVGLLVIMFIIGLVTNLEFKLLNVTIASFVILFFLGLVQYDHSIDERKEFIYSLSNSNPDISGSFFLGTGVIDSQPQYSYFIINEDSSKEKKHILSRYTKIYEDTNDKPFVKKISCTDSKKYNLMSLLLGVPNSGEECNDFYNENHSYERREFHVPKNTVVLNFKI